MLAEFFAGTLPTTETDSIARHLETCPRCMSQTSIASVKDKRFDDLIKEAVVAATDINPGAPRRVTVAVPRGSAPPSRIDGFQILNELGRGGMGRVFRAYDERLKQILGTVWTLRDRSFG